MSHHYVGNCQQLYTAVLEVIITTGIRGKCFPREGKLRTAIEAGTLGRLLPDSSFFSYIYQSLSVIRFPLSSLAPFVLLDTVFGVTHRDPPSDAGTATKKIGEKRK